MIPVEKIVLVQFAIGQGPAGWPTRKQILTNRSAPSDRRIFKCNASRVCDRSTARASDEATRGKPERGGNHVVTALVNCDGAKAELSASGSLVILMSFIGFLMVSWIIILSCLHRP